MKTKTLKTLQMITQIVMLALFAALFARGRIQVWMIVFLSSLVLSLFFGRFYCGWLCPIRTIQRPITYLKKKLKIKTGKGPAFLSNKITRYVILVIFLGLMAFVFRSGKQLPVLPAILALGVVMSLFFQESLWHRWLCPYGTLLSLPASRLGKKLSIVQSDCISCGLCEKACPAEAVDTFTVTKQSAAYEKQEKTGKGYRVNKSECLLCLECQRVCPVDTIHYG